MALALGPEGPVTIAPPEAGLMRWAEVASALMPLAESLPVQLRTWQVVQSMPSTEPGRPESKCKVEAWRIPPKAPGMSRWAEKVADSRNSMTLPVGGIHDMETKLTVGLTTGIKVSFQPGMVLTGEQGDHAPA